MSARTSFASIRLLFCALALLLPLTRPSNGQDSNGQFLGASLPKSERADSNGKIYFKHKLELSLDTGLLGQTSERSMILLEILWGDDYSADKGATKGGPSLAVVVNESDGGILNRA